MGESARTFRYSSELVLTEQRTTKRSPLDSRTHRHTHAGSVLITSISPSFAPLRVCLAWLGPTEKDLWNSLTNSSFGRGRRREKKPQRERTFFAQSQAEEKESKRVTVAKKETHNAQGPATAPEV